MTEDFRVYISDFLGMKRADERYLKGAFPTETEAIDMAKKIVEKSLEFEYRQYPELQSCELLDRFFVFGEIPFVSGSQFDSYRFAEDYVSRLCEAKVLRS